MTAIQPSSLAAADIPLAVNLQAEPTDAQPSAAQPSAAQPSAAQPSAASAQASQEAGLQLLGVRMAPFSRPRPGRHFTIRTAVTNASGQEESGLVLARIDRAPALQAAAAVRVPAGETRTVDLHLKIPADFVPGSGFDLSLSLNSPDGQHVLSSASGQPMIDSMRMMVDSERLVTAVVLEQERPIAPEWHWPNDDRQMSYECTVAARIDTGHQRQTLSITQESFPTQLIDWEGIDAFVIARDAPLADPVATEAMTRWLAAGGRAWIMLDMLESGDLNALLPDGMTCQTIDDIDLNEFVVEADLAIPIAQADRTVTSERPLRLRRIVQSGGTVTHRVDGFPAAVWFSVGKGQVLVTTLEASAWVKPRAEQRSDDPFFRSDFQMQVWSLPMAEQFYEGADTRSPLDVAEINYPLKHIGNPVLDRNFVLSVVFGFCILLALAGWGCWYTGTLTRMGWMVPLISVGAAVPLLVASSRVRSELPDASAHLQLIEVQPGSRAVEGTQWTTTFMSSSSSAQWVADGDAIVSWPDTGQQSDLRRWLWDDYQHWQLSSSGWPNGLWRLNSRFSLPPRALSVTANIDDEGLSIHAPSALGQPLQDAVLCYVPGDIAICDQIDVDQSIRVPDDHWSAGQTWLGSTIVDDEQARRDEIYRLLPSRTTHGRYPAYPALLGWTKLWDTPVGWSEQRDQRGAALVILPVSLQSVPAGQMVQVPHTVIRVETPLDGPSRSTAFANHSGLWREETTIAMQVPIRFHLPQQVCPIEASEIVCDLQLRAPQRDVRITALASGQPKVVAEFRSPLATERFRLTDPAILEDARDGTVDFRVEISPPIGQSELDVTADVGNWQIDYFRIGVSGRVLDR